MPDTEEHCGHDLRTVTGLFFYIYKYDVLVYILHHMIKILYYAITSFNIRNTLHYVMYFNLMASYVLYFTIQLNDFRESYTPWLGCMQVNKLY